MKNFKLIIISTLCMGLSFTLFTSCNKNLNNPSKSDNDSLAMANAILTGSQIQQQFMMMDQMQGHKVDQKTFLKGVKKGLMVSTDSTKEAYIMGMAYGYQMGQNNSKDSISNKVFYEYLEATLNNDSTKLKWSPEEASAYYQKAMTKMKEDKLVKEYGKNKEDGIAYLENFKKEEGVIVLPDNIAYKVITPGNGKDKPKAEDTVKVLYKGTLIDGSEFDKSEKPITFPVNGVIAGWTKVLQEMTVGEKVQVVIPQEQAYGANGSGEKIKPFSTLIFEIELLEINPTK